MERVRNNLSAIERTEYIKTSRDFFTKRNHINMLRSNNLTPIKRTEYSSAVNILKTDIIQLDNMVKKLSDILLYHRVDVNVLSLNGVNVTFQKRCKEAGGVSKCDFGILNENAKSLDFLFKHFRCINTEELIYKLALEFMLDQAILERVNNVAFLINLRHFNEGNLYAANYKENISKLDHLKSLFELISRGNNLTQSIDSLSLCNEDEMSIKLDNDVYKIMEMKNLAEFLEFKSEDNLICHIKELATKFYEKTFLLFEDLNKQLYSIYAYSYRSVRSEDLLGNFFYLRESLEKLISNQDAKFHSKNEQLKTELLAMKDKNDKLVNEYINKLEIQNETIISCFSRTGNEMIAKLNDEINSLNLQLGRAKDTITILSEEIKYTNTKLKCSRKLDDSYDKLIGEQFDSMKESFVKKINSLSEELVKLKNDYRQTLTKVENELNVTKQMKDLFMSQIVNLKKII
jgi:hypothetical protein